MFNKLIGNNLFKYFLLVILLVLLSLSYKIVDINFISNLLNDNQFAIGSIALYPILILFLLRSISIVIPILPGTYCSVIAGYLYGIKFGLGLIFIADFISCSSSFFIARNLGREFVRKLLGQRQMKKVEDISKKYLENNFFFNDWFSSNILVRFRLLCSWTN